MMAPRPYNSKKQPLPGRRLPWEPRIRVDARDMARADIRPRYSPPKRRSRHVALPRPVPSRVSSDDADEEDAAQAVALVVAAAADAETAATDAAVASRRKNDDDSLSTLTTRRPPGEQGLHSEDDDIPEEASPRNFGAALADALALAEDPRHAAALSRVLEDCREPDTPHRRAASPPALGAGSPVDAALEIAALLSGEGEITRRKAADAPPPPAPTRAVEKPPRPPPPRHRMAQSIVDLQRDRIKVRAGLRAAVGRAEAAYRRLLARAGREADTSGVAKRATNRALFAATREVEAATLALKRHDAQSARRRARPSVRPPLDMSLDAPVQRSPTSK